MQVRYTPDPVRFQQMTTGEIRQAFLLDKLFQPGIVDLFYVDVDRAIAGSVVPAVKPLTLPGADAIAADYFAQRREIGVLNIGETGSIEVDGKSFDLAHKDALYIGRGSKEVVFHSDKADSPAKFYLLSYPAHKEFPTAKASQADAEPVRLGTMVESNKRVIYKVIHPDGIKSCQLVMGFTELEPGCVWNTMPPHTHERRMEIYFYFDMEDPTRVFHLMGKPEETRHTVLSNEQAVISPSWSLHAGVGTGSYTFCWGMGGENQAFNDMDAVPMNELK